MSNGENKSVDTGDKKARQKEAWEEARRMQNGEELPEVEREEPEVDPEEDPDTTSNKVLEDNQVKMPVGIIRPDGSVARTATIKGLTGRVRRELASPQCRKNGGKTISRLLELCVTAIEDLPITGESSVLERLTVPDRDAIAFGIRQYALGSVVSSKANCPNEQCGEPLDIDIELDQLVFKPVWETDWKPDDKGRWVKTFKHESGETFLYQLPGKKIQEKIAPLLQVNPVHASYTVLQMSLLEYNGSKDFSKSLIEDDLDVGVLDWLDSEWVKGMPGFEELPLVECEMCGAKFPARMNIANFMFNPRT